MTRNYRLIAGFVAFICAILFLRGTIGLAKGPFSVDRQSTPATSTASISPSPETGTPTRQGTGQISATETPAESFSTIEIIPATATPDFTPSGAISDFLDLLYNFFPIIEYRLPEPTPTFTPTLTSTPDIPPRDTLYCQDLSKPISIPDDRASGVEDAINITRRGVIVDIDLYLNIDHTWIGDIQAGLTHQESGMSTLLVDRPGVPASSAGCGGDDLIAILDDGASAQLESRCHPVTPAISGTYKPEEGLSAFDGEIAAGRWVLQVADLSQGNTGRLIGWCMEVSTAGTLPPPNPTPTPTRPPASALVAGVTGVDQAYPLDCESRSAVDWAAFFGFQINETKFFNRLPKSDNPEKGFVGSVYGTWGQIPPHDYGVHAAPVAALLREYGVPAYAHRYLKWRDVQAEIAAGRPVIVWEIGQAVYGIPVYYTAADGQFTVVARYEHTVMVVGYTRDSVTIQDGSKRYTRSLDQFLDSWSVLRNMAILAHP